LWQGKWQFAAVTFVVLLGVAFFVGSLVSYENLKASYFSSYERLHFADFSVSFDAAPREYVRKLARLPGVRALEARIVKDVELEQKEPEAQKIVVRFISLPTPYQPRVNDVLVKEGRYLGRSRRSLHGREALMEKGFAEHHGYRLGGVLTPVIDGEKVKFTVVGLVASPEYILVVRDKHTLMPTPSTFGVIFISHEQAEELFDFAGLVNEVCVRADPARREVLMAQFKERLRPYGAEEVVPQEEQPSNKLLRMDLEGFRELAAVFPLLFLTAAALSIATLLNRLVHLQRPQIGFLRASGFTSRAVLAHYLWFAALVGGLGGAAGVGFGQWLSHLITREYVSILNIPFVVLQPRWLVNFIGFGLGLATCLGAGAAPAWWAAQLSPALAMREEAPPLGRRPFWERWIPALARVSYTWKIPLRNLLRQPRRTLSTVLGVAIGVSLIIVSAAFLDSIEEALNLCFGRIQLYDLRVIFLPAQTERILHYIAQWKGVHRVEPLLEVPVELKRGTATYTTLLMGLRPDAQLLRVLGPKGEPLSVRSEGLYLSPLLRRKLGVDTGDTLLLRYSHSTKEVKAEWVVPVGPVIRQPVGAMVFWPLKRVRRAFTTALEWPPQAVTGVLVAVEPAYLEEVRDDLYDLPGAAGLELTAQTKREVDEMLAFTYTFVGVMLLFGGGLAFAIVFNALSVNLLERTRELAALRTLGLDRHRMGIMTTIENLLMGFLGLLVGLPLGYTLAVLFLNLYESETISLRVILTLRTYLGSALVILVVVLLSQIPGLRAINRLDLAKATKEGAG